MPDIYLSIDGQQHGPYTEDQVRQSLEDGKIPADLPAWHEGLEGWVEVEGLVSASREAPPLSPRRDEALIQPNEPQDTDVQPIDPKPTTVLKPRNKGPRFKYLGIGAAAFFTLFIGGFWLLRSSHFWRTHYTPESYIRLIVVNMQSEGGIHATDVHYTIQVTGDSSAPLLCEIDYTIRADTGASGQRILPKDFTIPVAFKVFSSFTESGWKFIRITDADDHELPFNNSAVAVHHVLLDRPQLLADLNYPGNRLCGKTSELFNHSFVKIIDHLSLGFSGNRLNVRF